MNKSRLPRLNLVCATDQIFCRHALEHHPRRLLVRNSVGQWNQSVGWHVSVRRPGDGVKRSTGWSRLAAELPLHLRRHHPTTEGLRWHYADLCVCANGNVGISNSVSDLQILYLVTDLFDDACAFHANCG